MKAAASVSPRTAQKGKPMWVSLDAVSITRLDYSKHVAVNRLTTAATNSTVVRRALALYQVRLEHLLSPLATPRELDAERKALMQANRGDTRSVPADIIASLPCTSDDYRTPTLTRLLATPAGTSMSDLMKRDLERWKAEDAANMDTPPWEKRP